MGHLVPQVGNITMDQMMFDLTELVKSGGLKRPPKVGDVISLLEHGRAGQVERDAEAHGLSLNHWASLTGTIPYELMCGLRVRLPRSVVR
jgi:alanine racemase